MDSRQQDIIELRQKIKEYSDILRSLENTLAEKISAEENEKLEKRKRIYDITVKSWHRNFKLIALWAFGLSSPYSSLHSLHADFLRT